MVIGLLALTSIPTIIGVGNSVSAQKRENAALSKEQEKFQLTAMLPTEEGELREAAFCVLVDGQIYLDFPQRPVEGQRFCGYYFPYPSEEKHRGLVSFISNDPPALNWIYVDAETHALRYGGRKDTMGHTIGPWGWSEDEHFLDLEDDPAKFVARRQDDGRWAVYWHPTGSNDNGDSYKSKCQPVRLRRRKLLGMESRYVRH
ncbi:hypothetical protein GMORB2_4704 [Geosmithia morbida]|uniref:Uncharacterized protein n=1 Tax=Geosmithia morbida TaxID=1094350 RepID=A0A9P4YPT6_9HYPO|nr:uncharacterized protein GMORB2_4704 [Geosmithia morbida]KAF4119574.1 hypothetical protein GMORB2_4704 [Geosmithia morbida]